MLKIIGIWHRKHSCVLSVASVSYVAERTTSYFVKLSNANHDGVTQQICDRLRDFETERSAT